MKMQKIKKGDKLTQSLDIVNDNIARLKELFPEVLTEGKIDFKVLQDILGKEIEDEDEYYRFTWAGKAQARREAHKPSTGTLRPTKEESVNWDTTQNLYIEGDNLEVLKLLQKSYSNKIKMIYIDPPYNTGQDFVYKDNYRDNLKNYQQITGQIDDEGNKITSNSDSDGRYHSNWLNMMYPRLNLARNLLKDDGLIFISIDENESHNLKKLCDEIFGESNFMTEIIWKNKTGGGAKSIGWIGLHEYILCYSKNSTLIKDISIPYSEKTSSMYNKKDEKFEIRGPYATWPLDTTSMGDRPNLRFPIIYNKLEIWPEKQWLWSRERVEEAQKDNLLLFNEQKDGSYKIRFKGYLKDENGITRRGTPLSIFDGPYTQEGSKDFQQLLPKSIFPFPKPVRLLTQIFSIRTDDDKTLKDDIYLDFFSGSGTTAHAVMQLNSEDGGKRKHIMVQLPEAIDEKSEAFKANFKTIAEIGKERIRKAGKEILKTQTEIVANLRAKTEGKMMQDEILDEIQQLELDINNLDIGFKVFKLDSSNIKGWDGNPDNLVDSLFDSQDNIKNGRREEDVLFEILLKYGLDLTLPIEEKLIEGKKVFSVGFGALFICLANDITNKVAEGIGKWKEDLNPEGCRVIFKDSGFGDVEKTNSVQTLKRFGINEIKSI
jgi:adenine-specific DNA-methyltransferase